MLKIFRSIRTKTAVLFFLIFLIVILPANWLVYKQVEAALVETSKRELTAEAEKLLSLVRLDPLTIPIPAEGFVLKVQVLYNRQFETLFTSPSFPTLQEFEYLQPGVEADTLEIINVARPLEQPDASLLLSLGRSGSHFQQQLASLQFYLFAANAFAIVLAGLLVLLVSGWILKPIRQIAQASVLIRNSNDITSISLPTTNDESRQLAESINAMLQRINQSVKEQTNFFASAAHELRTPLAVMKAELTLASTEVSSVKTSSLLHEVERLERVIHDFLLISELKAETLAIRKKDETLDELLYNALKKVKYASAEYGTSIQVNVEADNDYTIQADGDKMENVIMNLVENAIKYSPRKSVVTINLGKADTGLVLTVTNPIQQTIEAPDIYLQEFKKSEALSSGLGMGLWICDRIVKLHGFKLQLIALDYQFQSRLFCVANGIHSAK